MKKYLATYGKPRFLGIILLDDDDYESIKPDKLAVVISHRGEEFAEVVGELNETQEQEYRSLKVVSEHGDGPVRGGDPVVTDLEFARKPTERDLERHGDQILGERENLKVAQELVQWHQLQIKLIDCESLLDEKKLFFYFTSDQRVDFRTLVKDLARRFKTRIELRQMGVRDEARIIRGISSCGLPCCCSYWLNQFSPIGIKMVKEQNIALNPVKISGICGRLMCCMSFEHKVYRELWNGLPGPGSKIKTPNGNYIVMSMDIAREAVRCHRPTGGDILVPKKLFAEFRQAVMEGEDWEVPEEILAEMNQIGKSCDRCRSSFGSGFLTGGAIGTFARTTEAVAAKSETKPERGDDKSAEEGQKAAHKRGNRRRGRRGTRKPAAEAGAAPAAAETPRRTEGKPPRHTALPKTSPGEPGEAGAKPGRPRRRRRRPRKPGGESNGAEAKS